ncbi:MAG: hypothetical protein WBA76_09020 [Phormidesmis sp.]
MALVKGLYVTCGLLSALALMIWVYEHKTKKDILADDPKEPRYLRRLKALGRIVHRVLDFIVRALPRHPQDF